MGPSSENEQVVGTIREFWKVFCGVNPASLAEFYAPEALLFGVEGPRSEPVRLSMARRQREYFEHRAQLKIDLGAIEVQWLAAGLALATYTLSFHAANVAVAGNQGRARQIPHGRATQIFQLSTDRRPMIVHEHLSSADIRKE